MTRMFTDIPLHAAVVKSLDDLVTNIGQVDQIEDDEVAGSVFIKIAMVAEAAAGYFAYVHSQAVKGAEMRLGPVDTEAEAQAPVTT